MPRKGTSQADDRERLEHMLKAAQEALIIGRGRQRVDLDCDVGLRRALVNCVQDIGEAAARTTDAGRLRAKGLPWGEIVATRHILVHAYLAIDLDILWTILERDLPPLILQIEESLKTWPASES
jgi:uncharacterized protein with HEPN domain